MYKFPGKVNFIQSVFFAFSESVPALRALRFAGISLILIFIITVESFSYSAPLLFFEAQGVGAYSENSGDVEWYSIDQHETMQKPSLGFDYVQKISTDTRDIATVAVQARAAYDETEKNNTEPQLYNAYAKFKTPAFDVWAGHNRMAFGLSSYMDSHSSLLPALSMKGYGYDRDWGLGANKDFERADLQLSYTTGSGMPVYFKGNYLVSGRASYGVLSQDNFNTGISATYGKALMTMGYELLMDEPVDYRLAGADVTFLWDFFEVKAEAAGGKVMDETTFALFLRFGVNLMEENRLKLEFQPITTSTGGMENYELYTCLSYIFNSDITMRGMYMYNDEKKEHRGVFQLYYYLKVI